MYMAVLDHNMVFGAMHHCHPFSCRLPKFRYQIYLQPILEPILRFVADGSVETGLASVDVLWAHVLRFAPHMTVMGEIAISVALLLAAACRSRGTVGRLAAKTGVSLALLLHLGTARCVPNHTGRLYSGITAVGVIGIRCLLAHNTSRPPFQELR